MGSGSGNMAMTRLARTTELTWSSSFIYQRMVMVKVKMIIIKNMNSDQTFRILIIELCIPEDGDEDDEDDYHHKHDDEP